MPAVQGRKGADGQPWSCRRQKGYPAGVAAEDVRKRPGSREDWRPVPRYRPGAIDLRLIPVDAYLLSRIDGATCVTETALISGMSPEALWPISVLLEENLARRPATPKVVIADLLKQPMVLRMPQLRTILKRDPNCPASAKG